MINSFFFDSDCISAFLWVNEQNLLSQLYSGKIVIPKQVYNELSNPAVSHLKQRVDTLVDSDSASVYDMDSDSEEYKLFLKMTTNPDAGHRIIGDGEAASLVLAKKYDGVIASNNMRDIARYVAEYKVKHITTADILVEALSQCLITESEGNTIWASMIAKRRKLGSATFSDYLATISKSSADCKTP